MEGVENTSSKGEASTASPQQPTAMDIVNEDTMNKQGLDSSVHAKNIEKEQTTDKEDDNIGWRTVGKLNKIKLFFPLNNVPGNNDNEKRSFVYNKVVGLISFKHQSYSLVTIYGNKMFHIVVDDEETATQVKNLQIIDNHTDRFMSHDQLPKQSMAQDRKVKEKAHRLNAYNEIYNRFGVKAPKPRLGFVLLNESFNTSQLHYHPNHVTSGQLDDWDVDLWDQLQQQPPDMTRSYTSVLNRNQKSVNNSKGKQKITTNTSPPQNTFTSGSNINSQKTSVAPKTVEERLTWLENQMVKFTNIMQKLADRVTTLEKTHVHSHNSQIFSMPSNETPPVNTQFTSKSTQFTNIDVNAKKRKIAAPVNKNTKVTLSNVMTTVVNTQTRGPSPVETEQMEEVFINNPLNEPMIPNINFNMPSSTSSIDSRLTSFEENMEQAFGKLDAVTKFLDNTSNTLPYINNNNNTFTGTSSSPNNNL
ncbi:unnamed protein product [Rhizophagus irregularis]|nr:unnamed protein product [Rhizophagus irregularis]